MTLLSSRQAFKQVCTVERDSAVADEWGGAATPDWETHAGGVPCRMLAQAGREAVTSDRTAVVADFRMLVPLGTDVTARDRIVDVVERETLIYTGPFDVEVVLRRPDHLELVLTGVS